MYSDEASCSDCKLELIENKWNQLLLKWLNKCVNSKRKVRELNPRSLVDVINKYKHDICVDDIDRAILCTDDTEPFIRYKYPILRLRYLSEEKDLPKKLFIMTSVLLFHCCTNSQMGSVDEDICNELSDEEQMFILKFCERLNDMEATVNNVECAIKDAYEILNKLEGITYKSEGILESETDQGKSSSDTDAYISSECIARASSVTIQSVDKIETDSVESDEIKEFNSSTTAIPSVLSDTSTFSDFISAHSNTTNFGSELDVNTRDVDAYNDSTEIKIYKLESNASKDKKQKLLHKKGQQQQSLKGSAAQNKEVSHKGLFQNVKESMALNKRVHQKVSQKQSVAQNQEEGTLQSQGMAQKQSSDQNQTDAQKYSAVKQRAIQEQEEEAAADLNETVTQNKVVRSEVLDQLVTQQKGDTISDINHRVIEQKDDAAIALKGQTVIQKAFAQKATVTHKEGDVQADSTEIIHHRCLEDCACSRCSASGACCGDFGNTIETCTPKSPSGDMLAQPPLSSPACPYPVQQATGWSSTKQFPPGHPLFKEAVPEQLFSEESSSENSYPKELSQPKSLESRFTWKLFFILLGILIVAILIIILTIIAFLKFWHTDSDTKNVTRLSNITKLNDGIRVIQQTNTWECINRICHRVYRPTKANVFTSYSQCMLLCMGPQLWPYPVGNTSFSNKIIFLTINKLEYKFQSVPSDIVHQYLAEAFKLFLGDLAKLENIDKYKKRAEDFLVKKMNIQIDVEIDPDPRLRLNTDESYNLKVETRNDEVIIKVASASFCGVRHGLETLTQLILLDHITGYLITLSDIVVKDAPSYKYRGLMLDTARNYIPVPDIMRTIDAMATCKLNTFHWRISDVTSFPLLLPRLPQLFEYGAYDRSMVYTKKDVMSLVKRARIRGIRVLIEVAAPGPVGRAWSWSPDASCPTKTDNYTCANVLCLRMNMQDSILDILQIIYSEILEMTQVDDIFHLSDSVFSLSNCFLLIEEREGFLAKALKRLKMANKGNLPKLPIIWYTSHLTRDNEAKTWERLGVQLNDWQLNPADQFLSKFKVIHSSKWDLSCEMKKQRCNKYRTWQEMYLWKSWRNIEVFTIEGGEAILWTDLVNSGNLDQHLWPRAAAVAERLWSDVMAKTNASGSVYVRLDSYRWRMLLHNVEVQPVWPPWCSLNPASCLQKLR